ncbi:unnamed protein product [Clavelina lepadiformis]|uniref:C2H2-type domain-containing protein n=1 Tax=Clavelina lepadiformis TaxID=159417 RepID=A0ABP0G788_CLALP
MGNYLFLVCHFFYKKIRCEYCYEKFKSQRGFEVHQKVKHRGYLSLSSKKYSCKAIENMWAEIDANHLKPLENCLIFFSGKNTHNIQQNCHQVTSLLMKLVFSRMLEVIFCVNLNAMEMKRNLPF